MYIYFCLVLWLSVSVIIGCWLLCVCCQCQMLIVKVIKCHFFFFFWLLVVMCQLLGVGCWLLVLADIENLIVCAQLFCTAMPLLALIWVSMHLQLKIYCVSWFWDFRHALIFARWLAGCRSAGLLQVSWGLCELVLGGGSAKMWVNWRISGWAQHCQVKTPVNKWVTSRIGYNN